MGIRFSGKGTKFVPEALQFFRVLGGELFDGESCVDEHRISRGGILNEISPDFRPDGAGHRERPVLAQQSFNGMRNGKTHGNSSFSGLLYSRMTGE
jgi:hypothetical protein